jgi:hypothetical protein
MDKKKDFVTSYFTWVEPTKQKEIVQKLENITKKKDKKRKK